MIKISIMFLILAPVMAVAQWEGFPMQGTSSLTWAQSAEQYRPMGQIFTGIQERCIVSDVSELSIVESWIAYAGTNTNTQVVGSITYTNSILVTTNIVTTNQIGPFSYQYDDLSGSHTATGFPFITRNMIFKMQSKTKDLYDSDVWVSTNPVSGTVGSYFASDVTNAYPDDLPIESFAGSLSRQGLGYTTNMTTNIWGFTTGGDGLFTRMPETTNNWTLGESHYTGAWIYVDNSLFDTNYLDSSVFPILQYRNGGGGTNELTTLDVTVSGFRLNTPLGTTNATTESVTITATNTTLTNQWYDVTNITISAAAMNTNDVLALVWTNDIVLYGAAPFMLYAEDVDELQQMINALQWTELEEGPGEGDFRWYSEEAKYYGQSTNSWSAVKTICETNVISSFDYTNLTYSPKMATFGSLITNWIGSELDLYAAYSIERRARALMYSESTNYAKAIDLYMIGTICTHDNAEIPGGGAPWLRSSGYHDEFTNNGTAIEQGYRALVVSSASDLSSVSTSAWYGLSSFPSWCNEPTALTNAWSKGFRNTAASGSATNWGDVRGVVKWDGFKFK